MSADSSLVPEGAVTLYYPPLSIPKSPGTTNNDPSETKQCSVRGCILLLPLSSSNKMCETCRGRHRVYASTKRARRKMEKAAVAGVVAARARVGEVGGGSGGDNGGVTAVWMPLNISDQSEVCNVFFFFFFIFFQDEADDVCRSTKAPKPNLRSRTSKRRRKAGTTPSIRGFFMSRIKVLPYLLHRLQRRRRVRLSIHILWRR